jgi:serine/threonine protein kinase
MVPNDLDLHPGAREITDQTLRFGRLPFSNLLVWSIQYSDTQKYALSAPYAAPERWRAERATSAADVYALGIMAFEMLEGGMPFPGPQIDDYRRPFANKLNSSIRSVRCRHAVLYTRDLKEWLLRPIPEQG